MSPSRRSGTIAHFFANLPEFCVQVVLPYSPRSIASRLRIKSTAFSLALGGEHPVGQITGTRFARRLDKWASTLVFLHVYVHVCARQESLKVLLPKRRWSR